MLTMLEDLSDGLAAPILGVVGAGIGAAGQVGSAKIGADAAKYVAKQQTSAQLAQALAEERAALAQDEAQIETSKLGSESSVTEIEVLVGAALFLTLVGAWVAGRI